jgi:chemotaxis protein MotB
MMERAKRQGDSSGANDWLTTFGDMVTLLFTFFVLVYSFCSYSSGEWETASRAIRGVAGVIPGTKGNTVTSGRAGGSFSGHMGVVPLFEDPRIEDEARRRAFGKALVDIQQQAAELGGMDFELTKAGYILRVGTPILFDRGSAATKASAGPFLEAIGRATHETEVTIIVTGHTCDLPISTADFGSNWELSALRATTVLRGIEVYASDKTRFAALARGRHAPLVPNDNEECRVENRRVDIEINLEGGLPFES